MPSRQLTTSRGLGVGPLGAGGWFARYYGAGNDYAGSYQGGIAVKGTDLYFTASIGLTVFTVGKITAGGTLAWQRNQTSSTCSGGETSVCVASTGEIVTFHRNSSNRLVAMAYNSSGTLLWQRSSNATTYGLRGSRGADGQGQVVMGGYQPSPLYPQIYRFNATAGTFDTSGTCYSGSYTNNTPNTVIGNPNGRGFYVGTYSDSGGTQMGWLCKASTGATFNSGSATWGTFVYSAQSTSVLGIAVDASDNVYGIETDYNGGVPFAVLFKLNSSGALQWQRKITYTSSIQNCSVTTDGTNVYASFSGHDGIRYRGHILKYTSGGTLVWQRNLYPTGGSCMFHDIVVDSKGYVTAYGQTSVYAFPNNDVIMWRVNPNGGPTTATFTHDAVTWNVATTGCTDAAGAQSTSSGNGSHSGGDSTVSSSITEAAAANTYTKTDRRP
jgi:hypothetical protein